MKPGAGVSIFLFLEEHPSISGEEKSKALYK